MSKTPLTATALAAAILAAASVAAFSMVPSLFVWAAFIGWASYDHSGANAQAALRSSAALVFGVIMAWLVAISAAGGALPFATVTATSVSAGIASFFIVLAARTRLLSVVPATFYGFASTFACLSLAPGQFTVAALASVSPRNILVTMPASLLIGTALGIAHAWLSQALKSGPAKHWREAKPLSPA